MARKTAAEHMMEFHKAELQHHSEMLEAHKNEMKKASGSEFHKAAAESHETMCNYHQQAMSECDKAIADELNKANRLEPTHVSAVAPDTRPTIRPVIRAGGVPLQGKVDPYISKIAGLSAADQGYDEETFQ